MARTSTSTQNPNKENSRPNAQGKSTQRRPRQALQSCDPNTQTSDDPRNSRSEAEINALESRICELEAQVAQSGNLRTQDAAPAPDKSIDRPRRASKVSMRQIRQDLGYDKTRWNSFRTYCRDAATSARLNWGENWKSQRSDKLSKAYNVGEDVFQPTSDEDTEHNGGDEGEDENEMSEKPKGKRKASA
ncbi:hypothetical protein B0H14DRAFT_3687333 [Mycena olivaceomarginata]|nr:hypothetical protein B0H14DRAFT_3687333 [Mycena olivaceomarginata]